MRRGRAGLVVAALFALVQAGCVAQSGKPTVVPVEVPHGQPLTERAMPLLAGPLRLADFTDGTEAMGPRAGLASGLGHVEGFTQSAPEDGKAATEKTELWFGRTASALYFVFACTDHHPGLLRTHLARRENISKDDSVSVLLDPFQDHRRGVLFSVNPKGIQADAAWTENSEPDYSYDQVWDSDARVTRTGWLAMIAIPYRSLRFRPGVAGWGVVFNRNLPRNSENDFWPRIASGISGVLTQEGTLTGIEGATGSHNVQVNPYALAQNEHTLNSLDPMTPYFSTRKLEGTGGGDLKAILKDSVVLDLTVNPDFSQVESEQPQFTVNQRYPVYFPELRPFFLENASYFATPLNLLYTRNIVHPEFGARVTGKLGKTNVGLLAIDDREPGEVYARGDRLYGKHALFAVGRASQDLGKGSSLGLIYADEEFGGGWNRVGGLDFTARINDHWSAQGQSVLSSTRGPDGPGARGSYAAGPASELDLSRNGHSFNLFNTFQDFSTGFITEAGFVQSSNLRSNATHTGYQWFPKHSPLQTYGFETNVRFAFDHQGNRVYRNVQTDYFIGLARRTVLAPIVGANSDTLTPAQYGVLPFNRNFAENYAGGIFRTAPIPQFSMNVVSINGGNVNYNPVAGSGPSLLHQNFLQALVTIQPFSSLTIDNTYLLDRNRTAATGILAIENQTLRTKINYQFTRAFSARAIVEYDSLHTNPLATSLVRTKQLSTEALLTWLPHPGTAIYVGYNNDLQNLSRTLCNRNLVGTCDALRPGVPRSSQYLNDGRQFFVKASYLFRF